MAPVTAGVSSAGAWQGIIAKRDDSKAEQIAALKEKGVDHTVLVRTRYSPHQYRAADDSQSGILEAHLLNPGELGKRVTLKVNIAGKTVQEAGDVPGGASGRIKPDNVQVAVVKKAEDGQGIILRLVDTSRTKDKTKTSLRLFRPIEKAIKTNIIEENEQNLTESGEGTSVVIAPLGIETLRVFLSK